MALYYNRIFYTLDVMWSLLSCDPMPQKDTIDFAGVVMLVSFALLLAFNQVVIKVTNGGFQPVFSAGVRSGLALFVLLSWMRLTKKPITLSRAMLRSGVGIGLLFALEFVFLFLALDLTTVSRVGIIFYTMPVWLALVGHFYLPGGRLRGSAVLGLVLAMAGVIWAIGNRAEAQQTSWVGDLATLGAAWCWAGIALAARTTRLSQVAPEQQLLWQLVVSAPVLLLVSLGFGPALRDLQIIHIGGLLFQSTAIACFGFLSWFWLLKQYPTSGVASFSFLSPVFAVIMGWLFLDEQVGSEIYIALVLVCLGLILINKKPADDRPPDAARAD